VARSGLLTTLHFYRGLQAFKREPYRSDRIIADDSLFGTRATPHKGSLRSGVIWFRSTQSSNKEGRPLPPRVRKRRRTLQFNSTLSACAPKDFARARKSGVDKSVLDTRPGSAAPDACGWCRTFRCFTTSTIMAAPILLCSREFLWIHQEATIPCKADRDAIGVPQFGRDRGRQTVAHRTTRRRQLGSRCFVFEKSMHPNRVVSGSIADHRVGRQASPTGARPRRRGRPLERIGTCQETLTNFSNSPRAFSSRSANPDE